MRSESEIGSKKPPNNNNKKKLPLSWQEIFSENFEGSCSRTRVNFENVPKGTRACRTLLQLWWELGSKSFFSAATFCLGLCFIFAAAGPVQGSNPLVLLSQIYSFNRSSRPCYTTPALLHASLPTVYTQAKLLRDCKLLPRAKCGKSRQTGIS